jgi:chromosome segregation ATPase
LQKALEQLQQKTVLLREKLSMAVKKGKWLVQERENFKRILDRKNTELESFKSELQEQLVACNNLKDQINKLLDEIGSISKSETELCY